MKKAKKLLFAVLTVPLEKLGGLYAKHNWFRELFFWLIISTISIWGFILHKVHDISSFPVFLAGVIIFFLVYLVLEKITGYIIYVLGFFKNVKFKYLTLFLYFYKTIILIILIIIIF